MRERHEIFGGQDADFYSFTRSFSRYDIEHFKESENLEKALRAQQIQGESYVTAGFVYPDGLDEYGRLQPDLDRSRGENVTYFLATPKNADFRNIHKQASVRVVDIPEGGNLNSLAAYRYSAGSIAPEHEATLKTHIEIHGVSSVKEIAALAKTDAASSDASYELLREITQQAIRRNNDELWLMTIAPNAYRSLMASFGPEAIMRVGGKVAVDEGDSRTSDELRLSPVIVSPCSGPDSILNSFKRADLPAVRERLFKSLLFITDGLRPEELSEEVREHLLNFERTERWTKAK